MTVKEIVKKYLEENEYDGLYESGECGCMLDDLMPCDNPCICEPGVKKDYEQCKRESDVDGDCPSGFDFCITEK